ncbi:hypothetical protein [Guptibacillus hwajinpoensis]|uniref:Uncharacterized protein n=1 Tax=Guptibacillus hwajinpoensis TaxID=208199 RepID=A0A0J6FVP2_9BACL|nr:hypothetical protein [Alkalihalobacillus macyae]KMM38437.1 hypothetical protein AB986_03830 [Alkalihalobacillus macyae]
MNAGFIVYIVTNPTLRSRKLCSSTISRLEEILSQESKKAGYDFLDAIVLETETKEMVHSNKEKEDCMKRNIFFERKGYLHFNTLHYQQPPLNRVEPSIPFNLFVKNYRDTLTTKERLFDIILDIYQEKYFNINGIDKATLDHCLQDKGITRQVTNC